MKKKTHFKALSVTLMLVAILLVTQVSAVSILDESDKKIMDWDNVKNVIEVEDQKYPDIKIENIFGIGGDVWEGELKENTDVCGQDCSAVKNITIYKPTELVSDVRFKTLQEDESWVEEPIKSYQFYIKTGENSYSVDDYERQCSSIGKNPNGTNIYECSNVKIGEHMETEKFWIPYDIGSVVSAGNYEIKLEGKKKYYITVDWQIKTNGEWLEEWAVWNSSSLINNITSYYKLDNSSGVVVDQLGINNGTNDGATRGVTGLINTAFDFERGDSDKVTISDDDSLDFTDTFTISSWIKLESLGINQVFISKADVSSIANISYQIGVTSGDKVQFITSNGVGIDNIDSTFSLTTGVFYHVIATYDNGNGTLYINAEQNATDPSMVTPQVTGTRLNFGVEGDTNYFDGVIDEVGLWNRSLSKEEINRLYNLGSGNPYPFEEGIVTLNSPTDGLVTMDTLVTFNATASVFGATLVNMSLYTNESGVWESKNVTTGLSGTTAISTWDRTMVEGNYIWNVKTCDSDGDCGFAASNFTLELDTTNPSISVEAPTGTQAIGTVGNKETLNVTFTDINLDACWFDYNGTNTSIPGCLTGVKNTTNFTLELDNTDMTLWGNDTVGNENSEYITWSYNITDILQTFPTTSVESATEEYTINVSYNNTAFGVITGLLNINGTSYTGTATGGSDNILFTADVIMPEVSTETNFTAYWTISLTDTSTTEYNMTPNNVTVSEIGLSICGNPHTVPYWNFTILNESNAAEINSTFEATFIVKPSGSSTENIFNFSDTTGTNSTYDFCMSPGTENYTVSTNIILTKPDFVDTFYNYEEVVVTNATREDNLYMLVTGDSTSFIIHVVDVSGADVQNAEVRIQRYYPGIAQWLVVEIVTTNYVGESIGHFLTEDADYKFDVYQEGLSVFNSTSTKIACSVAPCTVTLTIPKALDTGYEEVGGLLSTLTFSSTTNIFTYTYSDSSGLFDEARLYVLRVWPSNATLVVPCNTTKSTASGVITCDINGQVNGTYQASGYITRTTEFLDRRLARNLGTQIYNAFGLDGVLWSIFVFMGIVMLGISRPSLAIIFGVVGVVMLSLLGLIHIGAISIVAIIAIAIVLLMRVGRE